MRAHHARVLPPLAALLCALWLGAAQAASVVPGVEAQVQSVDGLNIRAAPAAGAILAVADAGESVQVLGGPELRNDAPWFRVAYGGAVGWASGAFLVHGPERAAPTSRGGRRAVVGERAALLPVPYRTQYDWTPYWTANCGPASLAMALEAFGERIATHDLRREANELQGTAGDYDMGIHIAVLARLAERHGLDVRGLRAPGGGYDQWSFDEVRQALRNGRLVIPQVHLATMPGHERADRSSDHFVVLIGFDGDQFIYHDPAANGNSGDRRRISSSLLRLAWQRGDFGFAAFSVGPGAGMEWLVETPVPAPPPLAATSRAIVPVVPAVGLVGKTPPPWELPAVGADPAPPPDALDPERSQAAVREAIAPPRPVAAPVAAEAPPTAAADEVVSAPPGRSSEPGLTMGSLGLCLLGAQWLLGRVLSAPVPAHRSPR